MVMALYLLTMVMATGIPAHSVSLDRLRVQKKPRFFKKPNPVGFFGFYWVFWTSRKNR